MKLFLTIDVVVIIIITNIFSYANAQQIDAFSYKSLPNSYRQPIVENDHQFNGYTRYWHNDYRRWFRYGSLFKMSVPNVQKTLRQSKIDIAEDLGLPGLFMEPGFISGLLNGSYTTLHSPSLAQLKQALQQGKKNVLIYVDPGSEAGQKLDAKLPAAATHWRKTLGAYQYNNPNLRKVNAYYLKAASGRKLFVVSAKDTAARHRLRKLIAKTKQVVSRYDLHKGMFGVRTLIKSVTTGPGHPLDLIGKGMNEGDTWFVITGYMAYRMKRHHDLQRWLREVGSPVVADLGIARGSVYGCSNYKGFQIQAMADLKSKKIYLKYARQHGCYIFRPFYSSAAVKKDFDTVKPGTDGSSNGYLGPYTGKKSNHYPYLRPGSNGHIGPYTGYKVRPGNKAVVDTSHVPFVLSTGNLQGGLLRSMVLFVPKVKPFTRKAMWEAILDRREVGVLKRGKMMGSPKYRHTLDMLLLDRVWLDRYFGSMVNLRAKTTGDTLHVTVRNTYAHAIKGKLRLVLPATLKLRGNLSKGLMLPAGAEKRMSFKIQPKVAAMNKTNPIAVYFNWNSHKKGTMTKLKLPPSISVYRLLYGTSPKIKYPVTIHNFTKNHTYPVKIQVFRKNGQSKPVFHTTKTGSAKPGHYQEMKFNLKVPPGRYEVKVSALGQHYSSQLGVGGPNTDGTGARAYTVDLNGDGTPEYVMENDSVKVTLLTTGARIIQYIVKSHHKNEFIQVWPHAPWDSLMANRKRLYYPFGGFEDFLGEPSLETFKQYHGKIIKKSGDYVQVRMKANYYGSSITKSFTLYGDTPLVGIRYAIDFHYPASNMLGPEPMLKIDKKWNSQVITLPTTHGIRHFRPSGGTDDGIHYHNSNPKQNWGMVLDLEAGWNAGQAVDQDLSWVGAFPVSQPLFLHMWFNTPSNIHNSPYTYIELQPWTPIFEKSTMYFSYYMWGMIGPWEGSLKALQERNLITYQK